MSAGSQGRGSSRSYSGGLGFHAAERGGAADCRGILPRPARSPMFWTIAVTVVLTVLAVVLAMNFATPEKKIDRQVVHRHAVADPQFPREMSVLRGRAIEPGNRVTAFQNGDQVFPAMLEAIRGARRMINMGTYIYWSGDTGQTFADALCERARAGLAVHLVVDWAGSIRMDDALLGTMQDAGVRVEHYRPLRWY